MLDPGIHKVPAHSFIS
ncbi:hypothetical protein MTR67_000498 [Solanum verrucosum]|uniref:Uncharacterized protein n=1 Tax=Solanum verrucosum TaxID=315347 RepID=A0AAF0PLR7_SOLVR|nr:hypothetical protein MTR67_000498 [Solanum verrucosum]